MDAPKRGRTEAVTSKCEEQAGGGEAGAKRRGKCRNRRAKADDDCHRRPEVGLGKIDQRRRGSGEGAYALGVEPETDCLRVADEHIEAAGKENCDHECPGNRALWVTG